MNRIKNKKVAKTLTCMIPDCAQIQCQPRFAMQKAVQHRLFRQDNCPAYNHVATVTK